MHLGNIVAVTRQKISEETEPPPNLQKKQNRKESKLEIGSVFHFA
jgi:hypothetical protein